MFPFFLFIGILFALAYVSPISSKVLLISMFHLVFGHLLLFFTVSIVSHEIFGIQFSPVLVTCSNHLSCWYFVGHTLYSRSSSNFLALRFITLLLENFRLTVPLSIYFFTYGIQFNSPKKRTSCLKIAVHWKYNWHTCISWYKDVWVNSWKKSN